MVEVTEEDVRPIVGDEIMRDRVKRLTDELDALEKGHLQAMAAFRQAVAVLAGMGGAGADRQTVAALKALKAAASAEPLEVRTLEEAGASLRQALARGAEPQAQAAEPAEEGSSAQHVVLALLEGLRLGDAAFDGHLERAMAQINRHMAASQVRPAMVVLVDLLDHYRQEQGRRYTEVEQALRELLSEVLTTESTYAEGLEGVQGTWAKASQEYEQGVTNTMGRMVREIAQATDLDGLKVSALEHVRGLRDQLRSHRQREGEILSTSQAQLASLREALALSWGRLAEVEQKSQALAEQALNDALTKVPNKRALGLKLEEELARTPRGLLSLIVFDIDHFKTINDTYGHQAGDRALQAIAHQAGMALRAQDTLFRYAGDEFVVLLRETGVEDALGVAERVRQAAVGIRFTYRGTQEIRISVSLGVAQAKDKDTQESFFERADQALYAAKQGGRDRTVAAK